MDRTGPRTSDSRNELPKTLSLQLSAMSKRTLLAASAALSMTLAAGVSVATARPQPANDSFRYEVTVTNVTKGQILGPVAVATHNSNIGLFDLGAPASAELAHLAEEGDPSMLLGKLAASSDVLFTATNGAPLMPGASTTITVVSDSSNPLISVASMLVSTNDAFIAMRGVYSPPVQSRHLANVYDAGTEFNSEDCNYIPGPPCGSAGAHDPTPAEGYVYISNGIHGIGALAPETFSWDGPAAEVTIRKVQP
jgi:hypothetical protein